MPILTVNQAAKRLGVSATRVRQLIDGNRLPASKFGTSWLIQSEDLAKVRNRKPGRPRKK